MKRRGFITVLVDATAAAFPLTGRAQQSAIPLNGYLGLDSVNEYRAE